jgi:hypothetical protein
MLQLLLWIVGAVFISRVIRCVTTPVLRRLGVYRYHSRLLLSVPIARGVLDLHAGTSWDFFLTPGITPKLILQQMAVGMVHLCDEIAAGNIDPGTTIRGQIHYFSEATLRSFGFQVRRGNLFEKMLFTLNYIELCLLQSIARGRVSIITPERMRIASCRAGDLLRYRERYVAFAEKIGGRPATGRAIFAPPIAGELKNAA